MNWQTILASEVQSRTDPRISIQEVPAARLAQVGVSGGAAVPKLDATGSLVVELLVDQSLSDELKVTILFHELGHADDFILHNSETVRFLQGALSEGERRLRTRRTELAAFTNSLTNLLVLSRSGWVLPLTNTVARITYRAANDPDTDYRIAIAQLKTTSIWQECLDELKP
jgi:hypothetical protein